MSAIPSSLFAGAFSVSGNSSSAPKPGPGSKSPAPDKPDSSSVGSKNLTPQQQKEVQALKARDADVRKHEAAHLAASGGYAEGGASYSFQTGPDGKQYAVGGEVKIDAAPVPNNPQATIAKMQIVQRAALAPSDPSSEDRAVAASAAAAEAKAQTELATQKSSNGKGGSLDTFA
jgi:hypothetical protein